MIYHIFKDNLFKKYKSKMKLLISRLLKINLMNLKYKCKLKIYMKINKKKIIK